MTGEEKETAVGEARRVTIDPITRLEGHGKIEIFLDDAGEVEDAYFQVPELRGFERFCLGRPGEELPRITPRICGVCPVAHHMASTKALDAAYSTRPTDTAEKIRRLIYAAYYLYDHTLHFYFLGGPDFVVGPGAPKGERNILGVINKVGMEVAGEVIKYRAIGQNIIELLGGKATHPVCGLPGGVSKALSPEDRDLIAGWTEGAVEFCEFSLSVFNDIVLKNQGYVDLITNDDWALKTYYMGLVNDSNQPDYYDGKIRVVDPEGKEFAKFEAKDYLDHIEEHVEPWSYIKFPYLKAVGWKGFVDGPESGIYRVAPLARLNVADSMSTPKANSHFKEMNSTLGGGPVHHTLAMHWARLVELHPITIMQSTVYSDNGRAGDWAYVPPKAYTVGPRDLKNSKLVSFWNTGYAGGGFAWQRFITRLAAHGPVTPLVPSSILQMLPSELILLGKVADDYEWDVPLRLDPWPWEGGHPWP